MKQSISDKEKKKNYCVDCLKNPETCNKSPLECRKEKGAELYFKLYDHSFNRM